MSEPGRPPPAPPRAPRPTPRGRLAAARSLAGRPLCACVLWGALALPVHALDPVEREEASDLVARCLPAVSEGRAVDTRRLERAEGPVADAVRAARGGEVWAPRFGDVMLHQAGPGACTVIAPGADPKMFAFWVERWSNGPDGRMWQGKWFGRLDSTAWRRFRRRGGGDVRVHAVTGADHPTAEMRVMARMEGR